MSSTAKEKKKLGFAIWLAKQRHFSIFPQIDKERPHVVT